MESDLPPETPAKLQNVTLSLRIMAEESKKEKNRYFDLMAKRKALLFEGKEEEAAKLLDLAEEMVKRGLVSDDEMIAAAYM